MQPHRCEVHHNTAGGRDAFGEWIEGLKDTVGRVIVLKRVARMEEGNFGDHRSVGGGVWELRIHVGPGYRVYYGIAGPSVVLLLGGGDKGTQGKDIRRAQDCWADYWRTR